MNCPFGCNASATWATYGRCPECGREIADTGDGVGVGIPVEAARDTQSAKRGEEAATKAVEGLKRLMAERPGTKPEREPGEDDDREEWFP